MKVFAVIPARGGSQRIPNKNLSLINGKPLIGIVIEALRKTAIFSQISVSTDSSEISKTAEGFGVEVTHLRPENLSGHDISTYDVMKYEISQASQILDSDLVFCIYPTAIFIQEDEILDALHKVKSNSKGYVISSTSQGFSPLRSFTYLSENMEMLFPKYFNVRSQDLPTVYSDAGMFYAALKKTWKEKPIFFGDGNRIIEIPRSRAIDINEKEDLEIAEAIYNLKLLTEWKSKNEEG